MCRSVYPTDLSKPEWKAIRANLPRELLARKRKWSIKQLLNALFYLLEAGCRWELLPKRHFPPRSTVNYYFIQWRDSEVLERINSALVQLSRQQVGRDPLPSATICDSQTVHAVLGGSKIGYHGGKHIKGRSRQLLMDIMGNLIATHVHAANISDQKGGLALFQRHAPKLQTVKKVWADGGYSGDLRRHLRGKHWVTLEIVKSLKSRVRSDGLAARVAPALFSLQLLLFKPMQFTRAPLLSRKDEQRGFKIVAWRWIVERTIGWLSNFRRLRVDYERSPESSEAWIYLASIRMTLRNID